MSVSEKGHWKRNYVLSTIAELLKKEKKKRGNAEPGAGGGSDILSKASIWKLKPGALSLYVGNGQREAVEAIGNFDLSLPSGLVIVLNNCHYAPSITRGGWFFEIDLSNSYANENSIYTVSNKRAKLDLDSALLWHCRLGHISKKRIEKLQHDGLLNSTDLRAFEKCVLVVASRVVRHLVKRDTLTKPDKLEPRSTRTRRPTDRMCLYIDAEEHELGDLGEPANYKATLLDPESDKWLNAMNVEMQSMKDNEIWVLVELSLNGKTVGSKWLFKKNTDMDGAIHTYKAHLMANGYTQTPGIDYEETFSSVPDVRAIRILIAIAAYYDYEIWQIDFLVKLPSSMDISMKRFTWSNLKVLSIQNIQIDVPYASARGVGSLMYAVDVLAHVVAFAQGTYQADSNRFQVDLHWLLSGFLCYTDAVGYQTDAG
ncbi:retrotransposon protein, putative, ty1-copia subclass [Tanacetum coccineum]